MNSFINELTWRGLFMDMIPNTDKQLNKEMTSAYVGFDPTSDSLHVGNLLPIIVLKHFQLHGHKPYVLVGGATGMVGDPSGKSAERNLLDKETLDNNVNGIKSQLEKFLDFSNEKNAAVLVNNFEWFENFSFLDFIRDVGKYITVSYMMAKDSVQKRLESGMSFTEFSYQLVQGYDFYYLNQKFDVKLQMGGSDQWGNMVTGTELIRKKSGKDCYCLTCPLLTKTDGTKFGKSESGNIWLDKNKTSPYKFYQYWLNAADEDAIKWIKVFTFLSQGEIEKLIEEHKEQPHLRILQKKLAEEVTIFVHSKKDLEFVQKASQILFSNETANELKSLVKEEILDIMEGVPTYALSKQKLVDGINIVDFLTETSVLNSKSEAKRAIQANSILINKIKISESEFIVDKNIILADEFILVQNGKKKYHLINLI